MRLFTFADPEWTPPAKMRSCPGRGHTTLTARFKTSDGHVFTASSRLERDAAGDIDVVSSGVSVAMRSRKA